MKNLIISMLAMAAMVSCTSENDPINEVDPTGSNKVEIRLTAGVVGVETRAGGPITAWDAQNGTSVQFASKTGNNKYELWDATIKSNEDVAFSTPQYYAPNSDETALTGFHPAGQTIDAAGIVTFTIDGTTDIMATTLQKGSRLNPFKAESPFKFEHLLTQLKLVFIKGSIGESVNVTKVTVKGVKISAKLDVTKEVSPALDLTGIEDGQLDVLTTSTPLGDGTGDPAAIIMFPVSANLTMDIETSAGTFTGISVPDLAVSTSYNVRLTFNKQEINVKSEMAEWTPGTDKEITVQ